MMFDALMQESMLHQMLHVCVASDNNSVFLMLHKFKPLSDKTSFQMLSEIVIMSMVKALTQ